MPPRPAMASDKRCYSEKRKIDGGEHNKRHADHDSTSHKAKLPDYRRIRGHSRCRADESGVKINSGIAFRYSVIIYHIINCTRNNRDGHNPCVNGGIHISACCKELYYQGAENDENCHCHCNQPYLHYARTPKSTPVIPGNRLINIRLECGCHSGRQHCEVACNLRSHNVIAIFRDISDAFKALKLHGQFTMVGLPGGSLTLDATNGIIYKEATVVGVTGRLMYQTWFECEKLLKTPGFDLKPALGGIYPLEKYEDAFQALFSGAPGKMVLTLEDGLEF